MKIAIQSNPATVPVLVGQTQFAISTEFRVYDEDPQTSYLVPVDVVFNISDSTQQINNAVVAATNYADQITVQSSQMFLSPPRSYESPNGKIISVVGRLTNEGSKRLTLIRLQVAVQNAENQLVASFEGTISGPLNQGDSATFRVDSNNRIHLSESEYRTHSVTVRQATSGK